MQDRKSAIGGKEHSRCAVPALRRCKPRVSYQRVTLTLRVLWTGAHLSVISILRRYMLSRMIRALPPGSSRQEASPMPAQSATELGLAVESRDARQRHEVRDLPSSYSLLAVPSAS